MEPAVTGQAAGQAAGMPGGMPARVLERVLLVDDEQSLVDGLRRSLYGRFRINTCLGAEAGLEMVREAVAEGDPFAVVVSDMRMPGVNGAQFLSWVRSASPDSVRMILSGQADLSSTIDAVNDAGLFRFLTKPCGPAEVTRALTDAVAQYRLVIAERELLERTVRGTADLLSDALAAAAPDAFARTRRLRRLVTAVAEDLEVTDWRLPLAAMLAHLGCMAVPASVLHAVEAGARLEGEQWAIWLGHPAAGAAMLARIPRLEDVAAWVGEQPLSGQAPPEGAGTAELVFHAAVALLTLNDGSSSSGEALARLRATRGYPSSVVEALQRHHHLLETAVVRRRVRARQLHDGMTLEQDVVTVTGLVLVRRGEAVSRTLALRLQSFADSVGVVEPIEVLERVGAADAAALASAGGQ